MYFISRFFLSFLQSKNTAHAHTFNYEEKIKTKFSLFAEIKKEINRIGMSSEENNTNDESITKPVCL